MTAESVAKAGLLFAVWAVCLALLAGMLAFFAPGSTNLADWGQALSGGLIFGLPYLGVALTAWFLRNRPVVLLLLLLVLGAAVLFGTLTRFVTWEEQQRFAAAEAAGQKMMNCGPPAILFGLFVEFLSGCVCLLIGGGVALVDACRPARRPEPRPDYFDPRPPSGAISRGC